MTVSPTSPRLARVAESLSDLENIIRQSQSAVENTIVSANCPSSKLDILVPYENSLFVLEGYATLDWQHLEDILRLMGAIRAYLKDSRRKRPLNVIMNAAPGSGKSHFVECLAREMSDEGIDAVTFNMASMNGIDDLLLPLDAVRNLKVNGKLPLLLLDEFDSKAENYALLLPLLWDGEIRVRERVLGVGKIVIILAGSKPEIAKTIKKARKIAVQTTADKTKLVDLVSRINSPELTIPDLNESARKADKICVTISLLKRRFGPNLVDIPWALLKFVSDTTFRHGVRSINNLVDLIAIEAFQNDKLDPAGLKLPLGTKEDLMSSHLSYHIFAKNVDELIAKWKTWSGCAELVKVGARDTSWSRVLRIIADGVFHKKKFSP